MMGFLLPLADDAGSYDLFVVVSDEDLRQVTAYDPCVVRLGGLSREFASKRLRTLLITYANPADVVAITEAQSRGDFAQLRRIV